MESLKKILPLVLVAVIFAVGGYFIGRGNLSDQGASIFNKRPPVANPIQGTVFNSNGGCWFHYWDGRHTDREGVLGADGGCHFLKAAPDTNQPAGLWTVYWSNGACWAHYEGSTQPDDEGIPDSSGGCTFLKERPTTTAPVSKTTTTPSTTNATQVKSVPVTR